MIYRYILLALIGLTSACSTLGAINSAGTTTVPAQTISDARTTVFGIKNAYGVALIVADNWAKQPRCGAAGSNPPPLCSTATGIVAIAKAQLTVANALNQAEAIVLKANPQQSELDLAIQSAQAAWSSYQAAMVTYNISREPDMAAVLAFITSFLPSVISIGTEIAPLISSIRAAYNAIGTTQGATQADFDALDALLKPYEDDLAKQAAEAATEAPPTVP